jgi:hypothetical protein
MHGLNIYSIDKKFNVLSVRKISEHQGVVKEWVEQDSMLNQKMSTISFAGDPYGHFKPLMAAGHVQTHIFPS